jgi:hypothetical protein
MSRAPAQVNGGRRLARDFRPRPKNAARGNDKRSVYGMIIAG